MQTVNTLFVLTLGFVIGSFLSAWTYRFPRRISVIKGRSLCPNCKALIHWYDNIPLVSYLVLKGKCRSCRDKISLRYPLIETFTAFIFVFVYSYMGNIKTCIEISCFYRDSFGMIYLPLLLLIFTLLAATFVIDLEKQIIPDGLVFCLLFIIGSALFIFPSTAPFGHLLSGFGSSLFLLLIYLITREKGMGLGDVKFALFVGTFLGWPQSVVWLFLSFLTGAVVGLFLIFTKKASFGKPIPFGPFLVFSFFIATFFGGRIILWLGF